MEKFILELITENNRVIIPNFGAFIISKEHGISILFNNFLSFNDGLLINYVAEKKGIDTIVATDQVFDYVDSLKKELDETGSYTIDKLGVFKKDDNGILRFLQAEDFGEHFDKIQPKDDDNLKDEEEKNVVLLDIDDEITSTPDDVKAEDSVDEKEITSESKPENLLTIDTESENVISTPDPIESTSKKEAITTEEVQRKAPEIKSSDSTQKKKPDTSYYAEKVIQEKKRRDIITFIVIAGIVIIGLAIYLIFFSNFKDSKKEKTPVKVTEKAVIKTPVKKDTVVVVAKEPEVINEPVIEPTANKIGMIHIIVGGFKTEDNAIKMVEKLRKAGYNNSKIVTKGNMFLVSIDSDFSYRKMEDKQQEVLENEKLESWMYQIK